MTIVDQAIRKLYSITRTPISERFYSNSIVDDILSLSGSGVDDLEAKREIVIFVLRLFDTPENLRGAGLIHHFVIPFLASFLKTAGLSKKDRDKVIAVIETWMGSLMSLPDKSLYWDDVTILESQIFRFHLEASGLKKPRRYGDRIQTRGYSTPNSLYLSYAPIVHVRIRDFVKKASYKENPEDTIDEHIRSARMFFTFCQESIRYAASHPSKIPEYYINNFVEEYDRIVNIRISSATSREERAIPLGQRAADYKKYFCRLINNDYTPLDQDDRNLIPMWEDYEVIDHDFTQTAEGPIECYGRPDPDDVPDHLRILTHLLLFLEEGDQDQKTYGIEAPIEEEFIYIEDPENNAVKKKPTLRQAWSEFIDLKKFFFFWDSNFLNLYSYSRLYDIIEATFQEGSQTRDNAICAFLMLLIHTGLKPAYLLNVMIASTSGEEQSLPLLRKEQKHFELIIDLPIPERRSFDSSGCLFTYRNVTVPVPSFLNSYVTAIYSPATKYLFSNVEEGEELRLDLTMIRGFLKATMLSRYGLTISPEAISNSFLSLYSVRFGMDTFVACYISKNHYRVFNAPLHYIFIPKKHLSESYLAATVRVHKAIQENRRLMEQGNIVLTPVSPSSDRVLKASRNERGYGSPQIPEKSTWITFVYELKRGIRSSDIKQLHRRHNLYSIYLYFAFMLATSMRPRNNPDIAWETYNSRLSIIRLADKLSPKYFEERLVPVSATVGRLIDGLRNNFAKFRTLVDDFLRPGFQEYNPSHLFFLLDASYEPMPFELNSIRRILAENYISFPLPLNTPRHYLRSSFYWENIHHELASIFMGHQTSGKEWIAPFSSVDFSDVADIFVNKAEKILADLGFEMIQYLPAQR